MRVFIATTSFAVFSNEPLNLLTDTGLEVSVNIKGRKLNEEELSKTLSNCSGVIAGTEVYSNTVLKMLNKLKVISRVGVGLDNIDTDTAQNQNIRVYNTKTNPSPAVAELTLGLILDISRKISIHNNQMKNEIWKKNMGSLLAGKTLGIIGLGHVGKKLVELTRGFNLNTLAFDLYHNQKFSAENNIKYCGLDKLLKVSDVVSVHLNLSEETKNLLNKDRLNTMKYNSILINTSRGGIVNEKVLYELLKDKKIAGAGIDVFVEEPYHGPLKELDNVILTPHIGSYAKEIRTKMEIEAAKNLIRGLKEDDKES